MGKMLTKPPQQLPPNMQLQAAMGSGLRSRRPLILIVAAVGLLTMYFCYTRPQYGLDLVRRPFQQSTAPEAKTEDDAPATDETFEPPTQKPLAPMSYGTAVRPPFKHLKHFISDLPDDLLPQIPTEDGSRHHKGPSRPRRLVIVGDVHGMRTELDALLEKVRFRRDHGDHLVLTGDLVNKGPDSAGVVARAMELGASAVRGNNEDRVLLAHEAMKATLAAGTDGADGPAALGLSAESEVLQDDELDKIKREEGQNQENKDEQPLDKTLPEPQTDTLEQNPFSHGDASDRNTVASLSPSQLHWLANLPVILRLGTIRSSPFTNLVVVHAGLVPGVPLENQDAWAVMNMRTLKYPGRDARKDRVREMLRELDQKARPEGEEAPNPSDEQVDAEFEARRKKGLEQPDYHDDIAVPVEGRDGEQWSKAWVRHQQHKVADKKERMSVVYGHDAKRGLSVPGQHKGGAKPGDTFGLDSGCVYGRQLTALVIEATETEVRYEVVAVDCKKAAKGKGRKRSKSRDGR